MEHAMWKGKFISATDVAKTYIYEKTVRNASKLKELECPDTDCTCRTLRYCHGEKKGPYFAHIDNSSCDYDKYDRETPAVVKEIKLLLFEHFKNIGYDVEQEKKLISHHYTHIVVKGFDGALYAIEIGTQSTTVGRIEYLAQEYEKIGVKLRWLVVSEIKEEIQEDEVFFLKRYLLNESRNKEVVIVDSNTYEVIQHRWDTSSYFYKGREHTSKNYPEIYFEKGAIDNIFIENGEISIQGFSSRFEQWHTRKQKAFEKRKPEIDAEIEARKKAEEESFLRLQEEIAEKKKREAESWQRYLEQQRQREQERKKAEDEKEKEEKLKAQKTLEKLKEEIMDIIDLPDVKAVDSAGNRWVKCKICGNVDLSHNFASYGGGKPYNIGECSKCIRERQRRK